MRVDDLFEIRYGNSLSLNQLTQEEEGRGVAFVSRTAENNGVAAWVTELPEVKPFPAGRLTVSLRSRNHALATFVQSRPFYTAYHVFVLTPRERRMPIRERLWWAQCIESNRYRYNYGRQANRSLPALELPDEAPDWVSDAAMPRFDRSPRRQETIALPSADSWGWFRIDALFDLHRGGGVTRRDSKAGSTPLVSASGRNNGVTKRVAVEPTFPAGWITVCSNGSVGEAFVQPEGFVATADVTVLEPKRSMSLGAKLFLCVLIRQEKYRFNYGRKWPAGRMGGSQIRVPALPSGEPDLDVMQRFSEALPFSRYALA